MRSIFFLFLLIISALFVSGCGGPAANNGVTNGANNAKSNSNAVAVKTATPDPVNNDAPTLGPVFQAYCDAWAKNDEAALRKIYSSDTIVQFEKDMKEEKEKSLIKFLEPTDKVTGSPCEAKNEEIKGDTGVVRIVSSKYPNGIRVVFVKEGGAWKITNRSPEFDSVTKSSTNSNAAK